MTLRALALWTLLVFVTGWFAGQWFAPPSDAGPRDQAVATSIAKPDARVAANADRVATALASRPPAVPVQQAVPVAQGDAAAPPPLQNALSQDVMSALLKMAERSGQQQTIDFQAQIRSEPWASEMEARIRELAEPQIATVAGSQLARAECRTTLCQAVVLVPSWHVDDSEPYPGPGALKSALDDAKLEVDVVNTVDAAEPNMKRVTFTMRPADNALAIAAPVTKRN